ncbi:MAG TPA: hypothetical protein VEG84_03095 [Thermoanaerobaculia bacterium]|nr:hypothetical protein [Thermoanaerobaculia bacterium]
MTKCLRGFAAMDRAEVSRMGRLGGRASAASGRAHRFTEGSAEAKAAGKKGGSAPHVSRGTARAQLGLFPEGET